MSKSKCKCNPQAYVTVAKESTHVYASDGTNLIPLSQSDQEALLKETGTSRKELKNHKVRKFKIKKNYTTDRGPIKKAQRNSSPEDVAVAHQSMYCMYTVCRNQAIFAQLFLLTLLSRVINLAYTVCPRLPIVCMKGLFQVPVVLNLILQLTGGSQEWSGDNWKLKQPHVFQAFISLGKQSPSSTITDYAFGKILYKNQWKKIEIPYVCRSVAISSNVPHNLRNKIVDTMELVMPILCGTKLTRPDRIVLEMNGHDLEEYDPILLSTLAQHKYLIAAKFEAFIEYFKDNKTMQTEWLDSINEFMPVVINGRFIQKVVSGEPMLFSSALALWKSFLIFASEIMNWITPSEAQNSLLTFWRLVLPESAPKTECTTTSFSSKLEDANIFLPFLQEYCVANKDKLVSYDDPWTPTTVGMLRKLPNQTEALLIFPREELFDAYLSHLRSAGGDFSLADTSNTKWHTKLQRMLSDSLPFIKTEGRDTTWRFRYYPKDVLDKKIPCLALILEALPNDLKAHDSVFGQLFGEQIPHGVAKDTPNSKNEVVLLEHMEKAGDFQ